MVAVVSGSDSLRNLFAALTEQTFQVELGIADPPLTDYLVDMLMRFLRFDAVFRVRDDLGRRLATVADMLAEAELRDGLPQREVHRHIGDFTLFWTGVFPEALTRLQGPMNKDQLLDYAQQGKRSYAMAATLTDEPHQLEATVMRRLSDEFELCSMGLRQVRREWECPASRIVPHPQ